MAQTQLLETVSHAAARQNSVNAILRQEMKSRAKSLAERQKLMRQAEMEREARAQAQKDARIHMALRGVGALCRLGLTPEFQKLLKARHGKSVVIYGDVRSSFSWKTVGLIQMTKTELDIQARVEVNGQLHPGFPSISLKLNYAMSSRSARAEALAVIAAQQMFDWEQAEEENDIYELLSPEALFEILVECANPRKREKHIKWAIRG